jgi:anti-anti-sigma factor
MQITAKTTDNCTVLELDGRLVVGKDQMELRSAVFDAAEKKSPKVILNLAKVTYVDICGIGELVNTFTHLRDRGRRLVLTNLSSKILLMLDLAKLTPIFGIPKGEPKEKCKLLQTQMAAPVD